MLGLRRRQLRKTNSTTHRVRSRSSEASDVRTENGTEAGCPAARHQASVFAEGNVSMQCEACSSQVSMDETVFCLDRRFPDLEQFASHWRSLYCPDSTTADLNLGECGTDAGLSRRDSPTAHLVVAPPQGASQYRYNASTLLEHMIGSDALGMSPAKTESFWSMCYHSRQFLDADAMKSFYDFPVYVWHITRRKHKYVVYSKSVERLARLKNPFVLVPHLTGEVEDLVSLETADEKTREYLDRLLRHGAGVTLRLVSFISSEAWNTSPAMSAVLDYVCATLSLVALPQTDIDVPSIRKAVMSPLFTNHHPNEAFHYNTFRLVDDDLRAADLRRIWFTQEPSTMSTHDSLDYPVVRRADGVTKIRGCYCNAHPSYRFSQGFITRHMVCPLWISGCRDLQTGERVLCVTCRSRGRAVLESALPDANFSMIVERLLEVPQADRTVYAWCLEQQVAIAQLLDDVQSWIASMRGFKDVLKRCLKVRVLVGGKAWVKPLWEVFYDELAVKQLASALPGCRASRALLPSVNSLVQHMQRLDPVRVGTYPIWLSGITRLMAYLKGNKDDRQLLLANFKAVLVRDVDGVICQRRPTELVLSLPAWAYNLDLSPGIALERHYQDHCDFYAEYLGISRRPGRGWARRTAHYVLSTYERDIWPALDMLLSDRPLCGDGKPSHLMLELFCVLNSLMVAHDYILGPACVVDDSHPDQFVTYRANSERARARAILMAADAAEVPVLPIASPRNAHNAREVAVACIEDVVPMGSASQLIFGYGPKFVDWLMDVGSVDARPFVAVPWTPLVDHWASLCHTLGMRWWETSLRHTPNGQVQTYGALVEPRVLNFVIAAITSPDASADINDDAEAVFGHDLTKLVTVAAGDAPTHQHENSDVPGLRVKVVDCRLHALETRSRLPSRNIECNWRVVSSPIIQYGEDGRVVEILIPTTDLSAYSLLNALFSGSSLLTLSAFLAGFPQEEAVDRVLQTWEIVAAAQYIEPPVTSRSSPGGESMRRSSLSGGSSLLLTPVIMPDRSPVTQEGRAAARPHS